MKMRFVCVHVYVCGFQHLHLRFSLVTVCPSLMSVVFSVCAVGDANAYPPDQSKPKRVMCHGAYIMSSVVLTSVRPAELEW